MMTFLPKNSFGCPYLILAPMEGVGDRSFRKAMASVGGFDEACTEFMRVPSNAHVPSLANRYEANETFPIPQAAQLMGSDPELMAEMARAVERRGAQRIDLNCGCPSNTVTGRGAGSSLLKEPDHLYKVAKSMVEAVNVPVTAKLRSGFTDTSLFHDNLLAAQASGIKYLTLHPRTKVDGYGPPAKWELIAQAKQLLKIPVVGNGDILTVQDALNMLKQTKCDGLMIGRGSVINPFIFHEIKSHFSAQPFEKKWDVFSRYIDVFTEDLKEMSVKGQLNKLKQLMSFLFKFNSKLREKKQKILTHQTVNARSFLSFALENYQEDWMEAN
ncbi:tRNA-dihydrouridine(16) synthase [Candidatus Protochlamydia amoebophila]|uniref:tRNA dihydrouridine synthase n=1 Tax=Candidatus Protochlamydia amoebophila TaxID=362787 RepID=UPI001BD8CA04|nr:tRNA-dihydrouridine synthase family protein [Candidatus Protochlamydia amoebophila]MBS4162887.1 tRNA-dihydrouridine(16) synthase [Candidatus Protochlamydia amoebophila]